jgi:heme/copper-type cytochrome/quinol oxidase subunit 3
MVSFLISEGVFFLLLILSYLYYNNHTMTGPTPAGTLNTERTGIFTLCLFASSLTIWLAG